MPKITLVRDAQASIEKHISVPSHAILGRKLWLCKAELFIFLLHEVVIQAEAGWVVNIDINSEVLFVLQVSRGQAFNALFLDVIQQLNHFYF
jgi:hypothetical protein